MLVTGSSDAAAAEARTPHLRETGCEYLSRLSRAGFIFACQTSAGRRLRVAIVRSKLDKRVDVQTLQPLSALQSLQYLSLVVGCCYHTGLHSFLPFVLAVTYLKHLLSWMPSTVRDTVRNGFRVATGELPEETSELQKLQVSGTWLSLHQTKSLQQRPLNTHILCSKHRVSSLRMVHYSFS